MMEGYKKYKDSGVEWIGEIPDGWEVKKLKYGVTVNPSKEDIDKTSSDLVVFLPMEKVTEAGEIDCSIKKPIFDLYNGFTSFRKNDVIVAKITPCFENGKGAFLNKLETEIGFGSTEFHVLRVQKDVCDLFLYYVTKSEIFMKVGEAFMSGAAGQKRVPTEFVADFPLASPPKPEQTTIANYLDHKTAEIDQLISQKEDLLCLYEEEKTAIINQAVTQGINPDVKLKDSGIDWLGEIPEHWEVKKLKYATSYFKGNAFKSSDFQKEGIPIVKATNIKNKIIVNITSFISFENQRNEFERVRLKKGDIIISTVGSKPEVVASAVGQLASINGDFSNSYLNQNTLCIRPVAFVTTSYLKYSFFSKYTRSRFDASSLWIANQA